MPIPLNLYHLLLMMCIDELVPEAAFSLITV